MINTCTSLDLFQLNLPVDYLTSSIITKESFKNTGTQTQCRFAYSLASHIDLALRPEGVYEMNFYNDAGRFAGLFFKLNANPPPENSFILVSSNGPIRVQNVSFLNRRDGTVRITFNVIITGFAGPNIQEGDSYNFYLINDNTRMIVTFSPKLNGLITYQST